MGDGEDEGQVWFFVLTTEVFWFLVKKKGDPARIVLPRYPIRPWVLNFCAGALAEGTKSVCVRKEGGRVKRAFCRLLGDPMAQALINNFQLKL